MPTENFVCVRKVFARIYKIYPKMQVKTLLVWIGSKQSGKFSGESGKFPDSLGKSISILYFMMCRSYNNMPRKQFTVFRYMSRKLFTHFWHKCRETKITHLVWKVYARKILATGKLGFFRPLFSRIWMPWPYSKWTLIHGPIHGTQVCKDWKQKLHDNSAFPLPGYLKPVETLPF